MIFLWMLNVKRLNFWIFLWFEEGIRVVKMKERLRNKEDKKDLVFLKFLLFFILFLCFVCIGLDNKCRIVK